MKLNIKTRKKFYKVLFLTCHAQLDQTYEEAPAPPGSLGKAFWTIRGTPALHLKEPTWIIDGMIELIVDFLFALVIFLDSKKFKINIFFFLIKQTNVMKIQ